MASTRLTNDMKETIIKRVIDHGFEARAKELWETETKLAAKAYDRLHPKKIREAMAALPRGYLNTSGTILVSINGCNYRLDLPEKRPEPGDYHRGRLLLPGDDKLAVEISAFMNERGAMKKDCNEARANARAVLNSVRTIAQLVKVWPEVEAFAADLETKPTAALAVRMDDLNAALRLPPEQRAA